MKNVVTEVSSIERDNKRGNDVAIFKNGKITFQVKSIHDMPRRMNKTTLRNTLVKF